MIYRNGTASLADILDVGCCIDGRGPKMIGYKTLRDLTDLCGLDALEIARLEKRIKARGHQVLTLPKGEEDKPWALYVFDDAAVTAYLRSYPALLRACGWPDEADGFVRRLALEWIAEGHPLRRIIDISFGNFSHDTSRSDIVLPVMPVGGVPLYR